MIGSDPTFTVSEFVAVFNQSLEMIFPKVAVVGELSNTRISKGRWVYFDLKDESSSVKFFGSTASLPGPLEDGMSLEVYGYPKLHNKYGFNVNIERIKVVGEGSIAKAKKLLERKLHSEGLFGEERKRPLPYPPTDIGLITSVESAVYSDFIKILDSRWGNIRIQLVDCLVQGADAPAQIIEAIEHFNQSAKPPQALIIIRGGGSVDDLDVFNSEQVVRAVAASRVPTLAAIGHERDIALAEMAADKRASTPSNAAEVLVPDRKSEKERLDVCSLRLNNAVGDIFKGQKDLVLERKKELEQVMGRKLQRQLERHQQKINFLRALDPQAPLKRGFAMVRDDRGNLVKSVKPLKKQDELAIYLSDGSADVRVIGKERRNG